MQVVDTAGGLTESWCAVQAVDTAGGPTVDGCASGGHCRWVNREWMCMWMTLQVGQQRVGVKVNYTAGEPTEGGCARGGHCRLAKLVKLEVAMVLTGDNDCVGAEIWQWNGMSNADDMKRD